MSDDGETDDDGSVAETSNTDATTDTTGGEGVCEVVTPLAPSIVFSVDGGTANLTASCTVVESGFAEGIVSAELSCTDAADGVHALSLSYAGESLTPGLEVGPNIIDLRTTADLSGEFGDGPLLELSDPQGLLLAQVLYARASRELGPFEVHYDSHCPFDEDSSRSDGGFVATTVTSSNTSVEVFVGDPQILGEGEAQWMVEATDATDECCHGSQYSVAMIRQ